jgi:predicted DNA-binding transcriptional regulator YafY
MTDRRSTALIRCLRIMRLVVRREPVSLPALAREFGVHERTIRRDLLALKAVGVRVSYPTYGKRVAA